MPPFVPDESGFGQDNNSVTLIIWSDFKNHMGGSLPPYLKPAQLASQTVNLHISKVAGAGEPANGGEEPWLQEAFGPNAAVYRWRCSLQRLLVYPAHLHRSPSFEVGGLRWRLIVQKREEYSQGALLRSAP